MVKVAPRNDSVRKLLKHPGGRAFPESGAADWPDDVFTHRRILDGDVTVEEEKAEPQKSVQSKDR